MPLEHPFLDAALVGAVGLGAYELWHKHHYGTFGFGAPTNQGGNFGGGYGTSYGFGQPSGHHHHHHHMF